MEEPEPSDAPLTRYEPNDDDEVPGDDLTKPHFWRIEVAVVGDGRVLSRDHHVDCGEGHTLCGPTDWEAPITGNAFPPSTLDAVPAPGWKLSRWEAEIHHADGRIYQRRKTSVKAYYVNYLRAPFDRKRDFERVTAVFVRANDAAL